MWYWISIWNLFTVVWSLSSPNVTCDSTLPRTAYDSNGNPSVLDNVAVVFTCLDKGPVLNISWAVRVDASIRFLTAVKLQIRTGSDLNTLWCQYNPPFQSVTKWNVDLLYFHYTVQAESEEYYHITASNLPEPQLGSGINFRKQTSITPDCHHAESTSLEAIWTTRTSTPVTWTEPETPSRVLLIMAVSMLAVCLVFATGLSLYIAHQRASRSLLKRTSEPVSVLMVYPAVGGVFQRAVVALADFLESSGFCSVAIDVWQSGRLADLGPLRWLHTVTESADRVLIVLPGHDTAFDKSAGKLLTSSQVGHTVPASAYELYPLALKMLNNSKQWVVHLGKVTAKGSVPAELRGCRSFTLLEDLQKLLQGLGAGRKAAGGLWLKGEERWHSDKALGKLKEVLQQLEQWDRSSSSREETFQIILV